MSNRGITKVLRVGAGVAGMIGVIEAILGAAWLESTDHGFGLMVFGVALIFGAGIILYMIGKDERNREEREVEHEHQSEN